MGCVVRLVSRTLRNARIVNRKIKDYIFGESWLTKQERRVLLFVIGLLLTGWAVKSYRLAHPPIEANAPTSKEAKK